MKKLIITMLVLMLSVFNLVACSDKTSDNTDDFIEDDFSEDDFSEDEGVFGEQPEVTIYGNEGTIWLDGDEPYDVNLSGSGIDVGTAFREAIGEILSVEKEGAEFTGWTIYAVTDGEWVEAEVANLEDGQACISAGDFGYYFMKDYEVISESATTEELLSMECDGRNVYAVANFK